MTSTRRPIAQLLPKRIALAASAITLTTLYVAAGAPSPLLVYYQREWHFPPAVLTLAFGIYALGLLGALLIAGSLSDFVGRRPVVVGALALEVVALVLFLAAHEVDMLIAGRLVQGVATGTATSALTVWMVELTPPRSTRLASIVGSVAPAAGLGLGALLAGLATATAGDPPMLTWCVLIVLVALGALAAATSPDTRARVQGGTRSLLPRVHVTRALKKPFARVLPTLVGAWLVAALFIGLMPTILVRLFGVDSLLTAGGVIFVEPAAACVAAILLARMTALRTVRLAALLVAAGAALVLAGVLTVLLPLLLLGGAVAGAGFGAANSGTFRALLPRAPEDGRSALVSAIYLAAYLAFGLPAIVAGLLVSVVGLEWVAIVFTALIALTACIGVVSASRVASDSGAEPVVPV